MPGVKDRLTDAGYGLGWSVVCRLPESWARWGFRFAANLAWRRRGTGVQVLEGDLAPVDAALRRQAASCALSRAAMRSYARYWLEAFRLPVMPAARLAGGMRDTGHPRPRSSPSRPAAGWSSPCRTWATTTTWLAHGLSPRRGSVTAVIERVKPESVFGRFVAFREGLGMEVLPASGGTQRFAILVQRLRAGKIVGLICDRDLTGGGMEVSSSAKRPR